MTEKAFRHDATVGNNLRRLIEGGAKSCSCHGIYVVLSLPTRKVTQPCREFSMSTRAEPRASPRGREAKSPRHWSLNYGRLSSRDCCAVGWINEKRSVSMPLLSILDRPNPAASPHACNKPFKIIFLGHSGERRCIRNERELRWD